MGENNRRWFGWWYLTIALGFFLLALHRALNGEKIWLIAIRLVLAAGFAILAWLEFRGSRRLR